MNAELSDSDPVLALPIDHVSIYSLSGDAWRKRKGESSDDLRRRWREELAAADTMKARSYYHLYKYTNVNPNSAYRLQAGPRVGGGLFRSTRVILVVGILDGDGSLVAEGITTPDPKSHVGVTPVILSGTLRKDGDYYILVRADNRKPGALVGTVVGPQEHTRAIKSSPVGPYSLRLDLLAVGD